MVISSSTMGIAYEEVTSWEQQPALYAFGSGALGVAVSRLFDVVAGLDLHLSSGGSIADFLAASLGLRMRLP
jgi:hypothetical protein